jgi:hypothetical protein
VKFKTLDFREVSKEWLLAGLGQCWMKWQGEGLQIFDSGSNSMLYSSQSAVRVYYNISLWKTDPIWISSGMMCEYVKTAPDLQRLQELSLTFHLLQ